MLNLSQKKQEKLTKFVDDLEAGAVQKTEFVSMVKLFSVVIRDFKTRAEQFFDTIKQEVAVLSKNIDEKITSYDARISLSEKKIADEAAATTRDINRFSTVLNNAVRSIPSPFDPTNLERRIESVRKEIPKIPEIPEAFDATEIMEDIEELENKYEVLTKELKIVRQMRGGKSSGSGLHRDHFSDLDITAQLDGSTKTFNIPAIYNILSVSLSSYPYGTLRKNIDYTYTNTTITFTDEIAASTQLANGQKCILTVVKQ